MQNPPCFVYLFSLNDKKSWTLFFCTAMPHSGVLLISVHLGHSGSPEALSLSWLLVSLHSFTITIPSLIIKLERQSLSKQEHYKVRTLSSNSSAFLPSFSNRRNFPQKSAKSCFHLSSHFFFHIFFSSQGQNTGPSSIKHNRHSCFTAAHTCHLSNWVVLPI